MHLWCKQVPSVEFPHKTNIERRSNNTNVYTSGRFQKDYFVKKNYKKTSANEPAQPTNQSSNRRY